ncbi:hypothetical protein Tco_0046124 [Tanacetum coccineum]
MNYTSRRLFRALNVIVSIKEARILMDVPRVAEKPWTDTGVWTEPIPVKHYCKPFNYKTGCSEWPTCSWKNDGYCNGGNLPGAYIIGNSLHYQDYEWYKRRWESHEITYHDHDHDEIKYENETHDERKELCETHELPVYNMRRFKMIKYSFGQEEEYVAIKEDEYDDLSKTSDDACRAYQEIFRMMDGGWIVTRAE